MIPPLPNENPGPAAAGALRARRCVRHAVREAAARCPQCAQYFCRECVVEHDGRLVCSTCLAKLAEGTKKKSAGSGRALRLLADAAGLIAAIVVAILCFNFLGSLLLKIPPSVHEGTLWNEVGGLQ